MLESTSVLNKREEFKSAAESYSHQTDLSILHFISRRCIRVGHSDSHIQLWDSGNGCVDALQER